VQKEYHRANVLAKSAIPHPLIMGTIRGKWHQLLVFILNAYVCPVQIMHLIARLHVLFLAGSTLFSKRIGNPFCVPPSRLEQRTVVFSRAQHSHICRGCRGCVNHFIKWSECGGKMHLAEESWDEAYEDFFEAFKNFDESGSPKRINCLKMLVLANMLMRSNVDPFDAQEVRNAISGFRWIVQRSLSVSRCAAQFRIRALGPLLICYAQCFCFLDRGL
jgi:hypothetical protein